LTSACRGHGHSFALVVPLVPLVLVGLVDWRRGLLKTWVPALACGFAFAAAQFAAANHVSAQLADIRAALVGAVALVAVPGARKPAAEPVRAAVLTGVRSEDLDREDPRHEVVRAYAPYVLIAAIFSVARTPPVKRLLAHATRGFDWPFLDVASPAGEPADANAFSLPLIPRSLARPSGSGGRVGLAGRREICCARCCRGVWDCSS
jgi:lactate permease